MRLGERGKRYEARVEMKGSRKCEGRGGTEKREGKWNDGEWKGAEVEMEESQESESTLTKAKRKETEEVGF